MYDFGLLMSCISLLSLVYVSLRLKRNRQIVAIRMQMDKARFFNEGITKGIQEKAMAKRQAEEDRIKESEEYTKALVVVDKRITALAIKDADGFIVAVVGRQSHE